ncbi:MAG: hypothetical protein Q8L68_01085 [Methylococcales bacterium]|nr:hypothetical protein [Methylococcales bacterium]
MKSITKNRKRFVLIVLPLLIMPAAAVTGWFFLETDRPPVYTAEPTKKVVKAPVEDLSLLLERMSAPPVLTPEQIKAEARVDDEQVALAREWLESADPLQRIIGAEQLSAYPTAEAEKLLVDALANDLDMEVRSVAARSLEFVEQPEAKTLDALLRTLEYDKEAVCLDVLNTLQAYVAREPYGSKRARQIVKRLKKIAKSARLEGDVRTVLQHFLSDQASGG